MAYPLNEFVLHFIWREGLYDPQLLFSSESEKIEIAHPGYYNKDAGPDFLEGRVFVGGIQWNGCVEIHIKSSDWYAHKHEFDKAYDQVILHVVWENDKPVSRSDGSLIPTIVLQDRVNPSILERYQDILLNPYPIPCKDQIGNVDPIIQLNMVENSCVERLEIKSREIRILDHSTHQHWDKITYKWLAFNFGFKKNSIPFSSLAESIPYEVVLKERDILSLEALFFGQAGFLDIRSDDTYHEQLKSRYRFLASKYQLEPSVANSQWKFLRMRPANFPSLRIAQFAALLSYHPRLFSTLLLVRKVEDARLIWQVKPSGYWRTHYNFGKPSSAGTYKMGAKSVDLLILNAMAPLLYYYATATDQMKYADKAIHFLSELPPENNVKVRQFKELGVSPASALESQGLIHMLDQYCVKKKCLNCQIGKNILRT